MFTYGIGESAERKEMKRPSRLRIIGAHIARAYNRAELWLDRHMVSAFVSIGTVALLLSVSIAVFNGETDLAGKIFALVVCAIIGALGVAFVSIGACEWTANDERVKALKRATRARRLQTEIENQHALELGKVSKQLLDTTRALVDSTNELSKVKLSAHNLAWALVEDTDLREITADKLSKIAREITIRNRADRFAESVLLDYARGGLYARE